MKIRVKWLHEVRGHQVGDVSDEDESRARLAIACGMAVEVDEDDDGGDQ